MSLSAALGSRLRGRVLVVGVGNPWRGDDGAGCRVAARLKEGGRVRVIDAAEIPESFLCDILSVSPDTVVFVDAVNMSAAPGAVAIVERDQLGGHMPTTHHAPLALLMDLVDTATHADVFVLAIQPQRFDMWGALTLDVSASADRLAVILERAITTNEERCAGAEGAA